MAVHIQYMEAQAQELPLSEEHLDREEARTTCTNPSSRHMTCCAPPRPALGPGTSRPYAGGAISTANTFTNRHRNTSTKEDNKPSASPPDTAPASTGTNSTPAHHGGTPTNRTHILAYNPGFACGSTTRSNGAVLRSGVIGQNLLPKWLSGADDGSRTRL